MVELRNLNQSSYKVHRIRGQNVSTYRACSIECRAKKTKAPVPVARYSAGKPSATRSLLPGDASCSGTFRASRARNRPPLGVAALPDSQQALPAATVPMNGTDLVSMSRRRLRSRGSRPDPSRILATRIDKNCHFWTISDKRWPSEATRLRHRRPKIGYFYN